jgi:hypothetical protein
MLDRHPTSRLRSLLTVIGLASLTALAACGGGEGAPNNPYDSTPGTPGLAVQPTSIIAFSGVPVTLTVTSGVAPFFAFSSNPAALPVSQNVAGNTVVLVGGKVTADTLVTITIQDSAGQTTNVTVTVKFSPIFNSVAFAPSGGDCGANLCSGQQGTVTATATGPTGTALATHQLRFDVVYGPFGINTTNPATPLVQTLTVTTDAFGTAVVRVTAQTNATTQPAQLRVTDVDSGQSQVVNFTIVNNTIPGGSPVTVIPATATITSALASSCSTGFRIDYYVYGGNPPYTISSTFPQSAVLVNTTVAFSGGFFEVITNGTCVDPLIFAVVDSSGKVATPSPTLINKPGTGVPPAPTPLTISPSSVAGGVCTGKTFRFVISGGSPSYNIQISPTGPVATPQVVGTSGGFTDISGPFPSGVTTVTVVDAATSPQVTTASITCT